MKLSVIIVNYNVAYFLEQCLRSVVAASENLNIETIVVDNNSVDNSIAMMQEQFPEIKLIANEDNLGFSKANNQAIRQANGEYVLLLNPDTIVEVDTFSKVISFMDDHPDAGGLGVKMIDGKGQFLPESKRGLPNPSTAFYKIFGLAKIFPKSKRFGKYHLGYLDDNQTHSIEVLSGAFMLLRKSVLDKIGLLDETFFMYGEDIDLSYRITQEGYKNYYFPETRIIHYKGESTKKSSVNYVFVFYNAMLIFAQKHFAPSKAGWFSFLMKMAIFFRASLSVIKRVLQKIILPLLDVALLYIGLLLIKQFWASKILLVTEDYFPKELPLYGLPVFIIVMLISLYLSGAYDKPIRIIKTFRGWIIGATLILVIYALLPESLRFSRAIILLGTFYSILALTVSRYLLHLSGVKEYRLIQRNNKRYAIIGSEEESLRVSDILRKTDNTASFFGLVRPDNQEFDNSIGKLSQIEEIVEIYKIDELVFCGKDMDAAQIIDHMSRLSRPDIDFKIAQQHSPFVIGSSSIINSGNPFVLEMNSISSPENKRNKRLFDISTALISLLLFPFILVFVRKPIKALKNSLMVLLGKYTWVGYTKTGNNTDIQLPNLKNGILSSMDVITQKEIAEETKSNLNLMYARDYRFQNDLKIFIRSLSKIGNLP